MTKDFDRGDDINYLGYTQKDLVDRFIYNPLSGEFSNRKTKKLITSTKDGRVVISVRSGSKILSLSGARIALMIMDNRALTDDETIKFIDGNSLNTCYNNIAVISKIDQVTKEPSFEYKAHPTEVDGVFKLICSKDGRPINHLSYYVVRRGSKQSVYRTKFFDEAKAIKEEWDKDHSIHRWDKTYPKSLLNA